MRILVTGKTGQLATALVERATRRDATVVPVGRPEFDLAQTAPFQEIIRDLRPDVIVSAAAYTAVDRAEAEPERAHLINGAGPAALSAEATKFGIPVIQISTDYVFDGTKRQPWTENDSPNPINVYGASKLAGEQSVLAASPDNIVLRVGWLYSPFGVNFVKTMLRLAKEKKSVRVVADQIGGPTSALDVADAILEIATNLQQGNADQRLSGIFHVAPTGTASWADLAKEIFSWLNAQGGPEVAVEEISTAEYPTAAKRPANSRLDSKKLAAVHNLRLPDWRTSLPPVLQRLCLKGFS